MANRYEILKDLKRKGILTQLIGSGIMCLSIATRLEIYEYYLKDLEKNKRSVAKQHTTDYFKLSQNYIYQIISFMTE